MTVDDQRNLSALPLDDGKIVRLFIENKRMGKIVWPYAVEALEALERLENLATRADERRIMCDEKDATIQRLSKRVQRIAAETEDHPGMGLLHHIAIGTHDD